MSDLAKIVSATTAVPKSGDFRTVEDSLLAPIKTKCRTDPTSLDDVYHYLSVDLSKKNGAVRYRALCVIDVLFQRSSAFRMIVANNIKTVVNCSGLLDSCVHGQSSSSAPTSHGAEVQNKVKSLIEVWDADFGRKHPQIHAIARYFRETLKLTTSIDNQVTLSCWT